MKSFRIGYVLTLSFLLTATLGALTVGYYPAPIPPKAPEYPVYPTSVPSPIPTFSPFGTPSYDYTAANAASVEYNQKITKYNEDKKKYDQDLKNFTKTSIVPYAKRLVVWWISALVLLQVAALFLRLISPTVAGAYAFSGVWAILFGPFISSFIYLSAFIAGYTKNQDEARLFQTLYQTTGITGIIGVLLLTILGIFLLGRQRVKETTYYEEETPVVEKRKRIR